MSQSGIPAVQLRALSEYKFVGHPLWRMADGKDHVRVELTFHKNLQTQPVFKKRAESRRQPAPSAGDRPHLPTAARRPPPTRSMPTAQPTVRREAPEKETSPPALQIMEITPDTITVSRPPQTAQLTTSPSIKKPATPTPSPEVPRAKRPRRKSPKYTSKQPRQYFHAKIEDEYPLHEKYDLQDVHTTTYKVIIKATRLPWEDKELNIDLPVFFVYQKENKHWLQIKGPTSKFYDDLWYSNIEMLMGETSVRQTNMAHWYDVLEKSCQDPLGVGGGPTLLVPPSYFGKTK